MKKLHLGCGDRKFIGWENYDHELDLRKTLPFESNTVDFIFTNHTLEHLNTHHSYYFLEECFRILKPKGIARIQVPSIEKILKISYLYPEYVKERGGLQVAIKNIIVGFGHMSSYTEGLLDSLLKNIGYSTKIELPRESKILEFLEAISYFHQDEIIYDVETIAIEATKL